MIHRGLIYRILRSNKEINRVNYVLFDLKCSIFFYNTLFGCAAAVNLSLI